MPSIRSHVLCSSLGHSGCCIRLVLLVGLIGLLHRRDSGLLAAVDIRGVYVVSHSQKRFQDLQTGLREKLGSLPVKQWHARKNFLEASPDDVNQLIDSGVVWPHAVPTSVVHEVLGESDYNQWRQAFRSENRWEDVRHHRDAPRRPDDGWIEAIDHTPESFSKSVSQLELWKDLAESTEDEADSAAYLILNENSSLNEDANLESLVKRLEEVPSDWRLVFLGGLDLLGNQGQHDVAEGVRRLYPWFFSREAPYLITRGGAKMALQHCQPLRWRLDCQLAGYHSFTQKDAEVAARISGSDPSLAAYCLVPAMASYLSHELAPYQSLFAIPTVAGLPYGGSDDTLEAREARLSEELDAVISWAMRLTDVPVFPLWCPQRTVEGNTGMIVEAREVQRELAQTAGLKRILEIGFNGGHSALRWLLYSGATLHAFDLGTHEYCEPAASWLETLFPERLSLTWGDSMEELPKYVKSASEKYDLIFIDGGHDYHIAQSDLKYCAFLANPEDHILLMDDTNLEGPEKAWDELIASGHVEELKRYHGRDLGADFDTATWGFSVGRYTAKAINEGIP
mmetsp:Transcript_97643/g.173929  ORF Transcript_97643/g.173929 Transcript_97643/m.173929 type:complete len:567 (+) Transcript_97643:75-1775(+)